MTGRAARTVGIRGAEITWKNTACYMGQYAENGSLSDADAAGR